MNQFIEFLKNNEITDIILVGFADVEKGIYEFYPNLKYLYIEMGTKYVALESVNQYSLLKFCIKDDLCFEYEIDEDMLKAKSSIAELVLDDTMAVGNNIKEIVFYDLNTDELTCAAMELVLGNGQIIFIDPSFYFGINVGGERQKRMWEENYLNYNKVDIRKIVL